MPILGASSFRQEGVADMTHEQLSHDERYAIAGMRARGHSKREIGRCLGRSASTICREVQRNSFGETGKYWADRAQAKATARRRRTRKKSQYSHQEWAEVEALLKEEWSPKQIVGTRYLQYRPMMSYETIYRRVRADRKQGGKLWTHMRHMSKAWRKRKGSPATRGRLVGKRHISERPAEVELRQEVGHCEGDTVMGADLRHCLLTMVERATGYTVIKKLTARNKEQATTALLRALAGHRQRIKTLTFDNGTEFHDYKVLEQHFRIKCYFATPYHSWERGSNENLNGLVRQYLPKGMCMKLITQKDCNAIAKELNDRPRKRYDYQTPEELYSRS